MDVCLAASSSTCTGLEGPWQLAQLRPICIETKLLCCTFPNNHYNLDDLRCCEFCILSNPIYCSTSCGRHVHCASYPEMLQRNYLAVCHAGHGQFLQPSLDHLMRQGSAEEGCRLHAWLQACHCPPQLLFLHGSLVPNFGERNQLHPHLSSQHWPVSGQQLGAVPASSRRTRLKLATV